MTARVGSWSHPGPWTKMSVPGLRVHERQQVESVVFQVTAQPQLLMHGPFRLSPDSLPNSGT